MDQDRRAMLDQELRDIQYEHLGYEHTYFEPPEQVRLQYDAMIYKISGMNVKRANNKTYVARNEYFVTWISRDPETPIPLVIQYHFERCSPGKPFMAENLYHFPFTIIY